MIASTARMASHEAVALSMPALTSGARRSEGTSSMYEIPPLTWSTFDWTASRPSTGTPASAKVVASGRPT